MAVHFTSCQLTDSAVAWSPVFAALVSLHPHGIRNPLVCVLCAGASPSTHTKNRQELYETSKALEQAAKSRSQHGHGKQGKKDPLMVPSSTRVVDDGALQNNVVQQKPGSSKKRHKSGKTKADGEASGSVEAPGEFACTFKFAIYH